MQLSKGNFMQACQRFVFLLAIITAITPVFAQDSLLKQANHMAGAGNYSQALELYKQAESSHLQDSAFHHMYGRTMALSGDMYGAIREYRRAMKIKPNDAELLNDMGVALSASGELGEAVVFLRRSIAANPKFIAAYNNLGATLMHQHDYSAAILAFQESLKMQPHNQVIRKKLEEAQAGRK
jgi:Flp pilus assembly protein TadD